MIQCSKHGRRRGEPLLLQAGLLQSDEPLRQHPDDGRIFALFPNGTSQLA